MDINQDPSVEAGRDKNEMDDSPATVEKTEIQEEIDSGSLPDLMKPAPGEGQNPPEPPRKEGKGFSGWDAAASLFILLLIGGLALWFSLRKPSQPAQFNSPVFPTATGMVSRTLKPSPSKTASRVRPTLALPATPTPSPLTQALIFYNKAQVVYDSLSHETHLDAHIENANRAREFIDQAIEFNPNKGDYYYLRYKIYSEMTNGIQDRVTHIQQYRIALENLETAVALGTSDRWAERDIPLMEFALGECDKGLDVLERIKAEKGAAAPPNPSLLNIEALGYNCKGEFDKSLKLNEQGLAIDQVEERQWFHAILLYEVGRKKDAMTQLDELIEIRPDFWGYRYYLRALINYEMGDRDHALADLLVGSYNAWEQCSLSCYVRGLMAMDAGNKDEAIQEFQNAQLTLENIYLPAISRKIEQKLAQLGAKPLTGEPDLSIQTTPLPAPSLQPTAVPIPIETNAYGMVVPSLAQGMAMLSSTGNILYGETSYPVFKYIPTDQMKVASVQSLSVSLQYYNGNGDPLLKLFFWNPRNGQWVMFTPTWGDNDIPDPSRFVDGEGVLYLAVHFQPGSPGIIDNLWIRITLVQQNGTRTTYDGSF